MLARVGPGAARRSTEVHRFANEPVALWAAGRGHPALGRRRALPRDPRGPAGGRRRPGSGERSPASGSTRGRSTTGCSTPRGAARDPVLLPGRADAPAASSGSTPCCAAEQLYARNGLQFLPFNTLYQLAAEPGTAALRRRARRCCCCRTCSRYWLTGAVGAEVTNASTTGLLDVRTGQWALDLADRLGVPPSLLPAAAAARRADRHAAAARRRGDRAAGVDRRSMAVGSHDTASAVVGVPAARRPVRLHLLRHLVAGRRRARPRRCSTDGQPGGELHQRGRRRRPGPLPAQRHGAVAAAGVAARLGPAGLARPT